MTYQKSYKIVVVMILATVFGLAGGIVGELMTRAYLLGNAYSVPLFGDINFTPAMSGAPNVIIRDAKNVTVEQDRKVNETAMAVSSSIVGIYKKIDITESGTSVVSLTGRYLQQERLADGFVVTGDGWIISDYRPEELAVGDNAVESAGTGKIPDSYAVIVAGNKILPVDKVIYDEVSSFTFWHVKALDLPVRKFTSYRENTSGRTVIAVNADGWVWTTSIISQSDGSGIMRVSDVFEKRLRLAQTPSPEFSGSFLFSLAGDLAGFINKEGEVLAAENVQAVVGSLLRNKTISRPGLGVAYADLAFTVPADGDQPVKGALVAKGKNGIAVVKGSAAELAGLKEGDLITAVNSIELDKDNPLNALIAGFAPGERITVTYWRDGEKKDVQVTLGEVE